MVSYLRRHHIGLLALFVALGGVSYAATLPRNSVGPAQLKKGAVTKAKLARNAVTGASVVNGSLLAADFGPGQLPAGERGPTGLTGIGQQGPKGDKGDKGDRGDPGAPGADFAYARTTIVNDTAGLTAALAAASAATTDSWRLIRLEPGVYGTSSTVFTLPPFVVLEGAGARATRVRGVLAIDGPGQSGLRDLGLEGELLMTNGVNMAVHHARLTNVAGTANTVAVNANDSDVLLADTDIDVSTTGGFATGVQASNSAIRIHGGRIGVNGPSSEGLSATGTASIDAWGAQVVAVGSDNRAASAGSGGVIQIKASDLTGILRAQNAGSAVRVAASRFQGSVVTFTSGVVVCVGAYSSAFVALGATCS